MAPRIEVLGACGKSHRARYFVQEFFNTCKARGLDVTLNQSYRGMRDWLVLWGVGGDKQLEAWHKHRESGRRVIMADIGYFNRAFDYKASSFRISVDDWHPQHHVFDAPPERFAQTGIQLKNEYRADGHILVCGMGIKSRKLYAKERWDYEMVQRLRALYPGRTIYYRPKPRQENERIEGALPATDGSIEDWLRGCFLCATHHSNAAVDAAVHGVPCVAFDGIGAALYGNDPGSPRNPQESERLKFLQSVAWFNWMPSEMGKCISFLLNRFGQA